MEVVSSLNLVIDISDSGREIILFIYLFFNLINRMHCSYNLTLKLMQACNAHGLYCVPLYDTLGIYFSLQFHYI